MYLLVCVYIPPFETFYGFFVGYIMHALRKLFVHFLVHAAVCVFCGLKCFDKISKKKKKKTQTGILFLFFPVSFSHKNLANGVDLNLFSSFLYLFIFVFL